MSKSEEVQSKLQLRQVQEVHCRCCNSECSRKKIQIGINTFLSHFSAKDFRKIAILNNLTSRHLPVQS